MPNYSIPQSALSALDTVMEVSANNIANINTNGFKASRVALQSGPLDEGVRVGGIFRDMSPGPAVINHLSENDVRSSLEISARNMRNTQENYDTAVAQDIDRLQQANASDARRMQEYREGQRAGGMTGNFVEGSNADLPREFAQHIAIESAYSATAATIRAWDEMTGSLLNVKV